MSQVYQTCVKTPVTKLNINEELENSVEHKPSCFSQSKVEDEFEDIKHKINTVPIKY